MNPSELSLIIEYLNKQPDLSATATQIAKDVFPFREYRNVWASIDKAALKGHLFKQGNKYSPYPRHLDSYSFYIPGIFTPDNLMEIAKDNQAHLPLEETPAEVMIMFFRALITLYELTSIEYKQFEWYKLLIENADDD